MADFEKHNACCGHNRRLQNHRSVDKRGRACRGDDACCRDGFRVKNSRPIARYQGDPYVKQGAHSRVQLSSDGEEFRKARKQHAVLNPAVQPHEHDGPESARKSPLPFALLHWIPLLLSGAHCIVFRQANRCPFSPLSRYPCQGDASHQGFYEECPCAGK